MQYTWQLALVLVPACIFHKTLGLMLYLLRTALLNTLIHALYNDPINLLMA